MGRGIRNIAIILVALAVMGWFLQYMAYSGGASSEEVKARLVRELQELDGFVEHRALLLEIIEREHDLHFGNPYDRSRPFNWNQYRARMYRSLVSALEENGEREAAIEMDRKSGPG